MADTVVIAEVTDVQCAPSQRPHGECVESAAQYTSVLKIQKVLKGKNVKTLKFIFETITLTEDCEGQPLSGYSSGDAGQFYLNCHPKTQECSLTYPNSVHNIKVGKGGMPDCQK